jgi:oxygen-independent coproporphyrinogen III oxidase
MDIELIRKYNVPGPRYTSYPTVPYWDKEGISLSDWKETVKQSFKESNQKGISLYIHLPFCENLCTFCGCHKRITKRHEVEEPYIDTVIKEWQLYLGLFDEKPLIKEIHLGGGTPTFFSSESLTKLMNGLLENAIVADKCEFSFEGHPNHTAKEQLQTLYNLGFRRVSFGVQDYDPKVQKTINRIQPFENVKQVHDWSKEIGYTSISHDLVFGLPHQTKENIKNTIEKTNLLKPDRLAYYSYAHVPWIKGLGQRGFNENDLPKDEEKRELYELGKQLFDQNAYVEIGMDHFALKSDDMYDAMKNNTLHRNFMGYTTNNTQLMIGLGMSSISDSWYSFAQNVKTVEEYQEIVNKGEFPVFKGHLLNEEDLLLRKHILAIMCQFETSWENPESQSPIIDEAISKMDELVNDGLVEIGNKTLKVTEKGKPFVRNICMLFDARLNRAKPNTPTFSSTI